MTNLSTHDNVKTKFKESICDTSTAVFGNSNYTFSITSCNANKSDIIDRVIDPLLNITRNTNRKLIKISGFVKNTSDYQLLLNQLKENIKPLPPTTVTVQPPLIKDDIALLYWFVDSAPGVKIDRIADAIVKVYHDDLEFIHIGNLRFKPVRFSSSQCKEDWYYSHWKHLDSILLKAGSTGDDILRLWLFISDITKRENGVENYQLINNARSRYFSERIFFKGSKSYPASTGIGTKDNTLAMHCIAFRSNGSNVFVAPLENPIQDCTIDYNEQYGCVRPQFSRGVAIAYQKRVMVFVSGTASIVGSETTFINDPEEQCKQTLNNIDLLLSKQNFNANGISVYEEGLKTLAYTKVYIKNRAHLNRIKEICHDRLPNIPMLFLEADICRSKLFVEIEGVAFTGCETI